MVIITRKYRDALKKLFESSIAQGHPAPEIQLFVDPDLSNELTRYQDSIEKSHKDRIDRGRTVDELYQGEEGLRPPAAMRVRLQEYYFKTLIDGGSTVDELYQGDEGSRPPAAMRVRLQEYYFKTLIDRGSTVNELYKGEEDSRPSAAIRPLLQEYYFKTFFDKISNHDDNSRTNELPMHVQKYCAAVYLMHKLTNPLATQSQCAETISQVYPKAKSGWASRFKYLYNDVERYLNNDVESSSNSELLKARLIEYTSKLERDNKSVRMYIRKTLSSQLSSGSSLFSPVQQSTARSRDDSASLLSATRT